MEKIKSPAELRNLLIASMKAVADGRITVQQANAISSLSGEIHKSIKLEYVGQVLAKDSIDFVNGRVVHLLEK